MLSLSLSLVPLLDFEEPFRLDGGDVLDAERDEDESDAILLLGGIWAWLGPRLKLKVMKVEWLGIEFSIRLIDFISVPMRRNGLLVSFLNRL